MQPWIGAAVLARVLEGAEGRVEVGQHKPEVIALIGVNGAGKTTTSAKLGHMYQKDGYSMLLGACDTFRAAANEQIKHWAEQLNIDLVSSQHGADSAAVAYDAYEAAVKRGRDIVILDTAGRLHTKNNLMKELENSNACSRNRTKPHHTTAGSWSTAASDPTPSNRRASSTKAFPSPAWSLPSSMAPSRGGALVGIYRELKLPIYFVGLGEQADDLQPFSAQNYANAIFGISDDN